MPRQFASLAVAALLLLQLLFIPQQAALAAIPVTSDAATSQNFDSLGTSPTATLPADFRVDKFTTARTLGTYASASAATERVGGASLSTSASNGTYNFGSGTTTTGADRAVGFLASGTGTGSGNLYAHLVNSAGAALAGLRLSYDVEKYRNGSNAAGFRVQLYYSHDGASWTSAGSEFLTGFAADGNNNGFATAPGATASVSDKTLNVSVPAGASLYLAWNYSVNTGSTVTNAQALAVDNISILALQDTNPPPTPTPTPTATPTPTPTNPTAVGSANPATAQAGASTLLTVNVTPGANPTSDGLTVTADLSSIGGLSAQPFADAGNNAFTFQAVVAQGTAPGVKALPVAVADAQGRTANTSISLTVEQPPPPVDHVVISQVYGGGGNSNATYTNDYVELYNPTSQTFVLNGWSIQYGAATGTTWTNRQPIGGTIAPGEYYLVRLASGGANGSPLPVESNIAGDINLSGTAGKVALVSNSDPLTGGACPIGTDPDLVDFVGYGTTANCWEGSARAPAPSNTTALYRKGDGAADTNQNGADFFASAPLPRRTAPIVELGPWAAGTEPVNNGSNVPHDATVTISFSEPVEAVGSWFNINCSATGLHNDATVAHSADFKSYAVTPNTNFQFGEQCTVTVGKDAIRDLDTDDSAPDTDTLLADYVWSFTVVAAGAPAPYPASVHLALGNPSNAAADPAQPDNYLMEKAAFTLSYNRDRGTPNWVSWHLDSSWYGTLARFDTFRADPAVPADWYRVQSTDYVASGFDRGHLTPNADRDHQDSVPLNQATFLMTNMIPQAPDNNQGPWANLENYLRTVTDVGNEIYIVAGPAGAGGTGSNGFATSIAQGRVTVPSHTWKVALVLPRGDGDASRATAETRTIAVIMPNTQGIRTSNSNDWQAYLTTVDAVEQLTGYDFFSNLPDEVENSVEAGTNGANPPGAADGAYTTDEDTPVSITLTAAGAGDPASLTYTIVSGPAQGTLAGAGAARTYTPAPDFAGTDSITFRVTDGTRTSNTATVSLLVNEVNDAPAAFADAASVDQDASVEINVLANDTDKDGDALTVSAVTQGAHGSVAVSAGGVSYTPAAGYVGADSFEYTAGDGRGGTSTAAVSVTVRDTAAPQLSVPGNIRAEATTADGAQVTYAVSATDNSGVPPSVQCSVASGALFPVGVTAVGCQAADASGNKSPVVTFHVSVVDLPPVLILPSTVITNSTAPGGGANVSFAPTATDAVSGARPVSCDPASGGFFPVGQTTVSCSATDDAGQTASGSFLVYVLASGQEGSPVEAGPNVTVQPEGGPAMTFGEVLSPGVTTVTPVSDPAEIGQVLEGFVISDVVAFKIETTATFDKTQGVTLAFVVPPFDGDGDGVDDLTLADFNAMTVLHKHDDRLDVLTVTGRDFSTRTIYVTTDSFSSFYLARQAERRVVALFDKSQAFKAGSTIPVKLGLVDGTGRNVASPATTLNARGIRLIGAAADTPTLNDAGRANADNNFRFVGADGGSYLYNLSTRGFAPGRYALSLYVGRDQFFYTVTFDVK